VEEGKRISSLSISFRVYARVTEQLMAIAPKTVGDKYLVTDYLVIRVANNQY
jgi:hypothetical protein